MKNNFITQNTYKDYTPTFQLYIGKPAMVVQDSSMEISELEITRFETQKIITKSGYSNYKKVLNTRLDYLFEVLDEEQDKEIFGLSRKSFDLFIKFIKKTEIPLISVDNVGNIIFEWHNYKSFDFIIMLFRTDSKISLTGIKEKKCIIKIQGEIEEVGKNFLKIL